MGSLEAKSGSSYMKQTIDDEVDDVGVTLYQTVEALLANQERCSDIQFGPRVRFSLRLRSHGNDIVPV